MRDRDRLTGLPKVFAALLRKGRGSILAPADTPLVPYILLGAAQSAAWTLALLALASLIFRRRDFL